MSVKTTEDKLDQTDRSKTRKTYLITYNQTDLRKFPTRESFS